MTRFAERFRIAIVDDDRPMLAFFSDVLTGAGFSVRAYRTGEEALTALWSDPVDLLVVDLLLPKMSGLDLVRELRGRPGLEAMPVLAVTALQWKDEQVNAAMRSLAPALLLRKPVSPSRLLVSLAGLLGAHARRVPAPVGEGSAADELDVSIAEAADPTAAPVTLEVNLLTPREILEEYTQNLCHDGLFVRSYEPLPLESMVRVLLRVPFRSTAVEARGQVVRAVPATSPEARTQGVGMAIALLDLPKDFKRELYAYVSGLRAGASSSGPPQVVLRSLLVIGLENRLPHQTTSFLRRGDVQSAWASTYEAALPALTKRSRAWSIVIDVEQLGPDPRSRILALERAGAEWIAVVGNPRLAEPLGSRVHVLDAALPPHALLDRLSEQLSYAPRAAARVPCRLHVSGSRVDGALAGTVENLSLGGLLMLTDTPCAVGERFRVQFELPEGAGRVAGWISAVRVSRPKADSNELAIAASFDRIDADSVERLRRFLESKVGPEAYRRMLQLHPPSFWH